MGNIYCYPLRSEPWRRGCSCSKLPACSSLSGCDRQAVVGNKGEGSVRGAAVRRGLCVSGALGEHGLINQVN